MRPEFILQVDADLSRLACSVMVGGDAAAGALETGLRQLASVLATAPFDGLATVIDTMMRAADVAEAGNESETLAAVDAAWNAWKAAADGTGQPDASTDAASTGTNARVEDDVEALRMDPELSGMFIVEALDHLGTIETSVLALEAAPGDTKLLNDIFRPFHTVKGNSGALGVRTVQELAHRVENLLDLGRSGKLAIGPRETEVILKAVDLLTAMITDLQHRLNGDPGQDLEAARLELMTLVDAAIAQEELDPQLIAPVVAEESSVAGTAAKASPLKRRAEDTGAASVKIDTRKLDSLVDMVGELVIVQSIIHSDPALQKIDERLTRNLAQLQRITSDLQRNAMAMRMVPIRQTFQKMARLVRDLSKHSGKQVDLVLSGEDTELDRKVVEDINDPLMHMVRNSIDHGIEDGATRQSRGKSATGRLLLKAYHQGGSIVIEIEDDGGGLNTERIRQKAIAQGLVDADAQLDPAVIHQMIFRPGFSTAQQVTEISGRGVGMDVVRRNIEALRGRIEIHSRPGEGTTFLIRLPLTLAIVDGLVLRTGAQRFVLPTFAVRESLRPLPEHVHTVHGQPRMVQVRNSLIPLVRLAELFAIEGAVEHAWEGTVVVLEDEDHHVALVIDELVGKQEVVIKSLGDAFGTVPGVAGGAILGDGRVGLILDAHGIVAMMQGREAKAA
jgi:two-component system, chemotaxis family, sensor kinase CheA